MAAVDRSLVAAMPIFAGIAPAELDALLAQAHSARYARNTALFGQGSKAHSFFLLLHGHVRAAKTTPTGQQVVVRYVTPGETFGVASRSGYRIIQPPPQRSTRAWLSRGPLQPGPSSLRSIRCSLATLCRSSARGYKRATAASLRCRPSRSSGVSLVHYCGWFNRRDARSKAASRSIFRSVGRTSPK